MGKGEMNLGEEFKDIIGDLKNLLAANKEMGLEPPHLSPSTIDYLQKGVSIMGSLDELKELIGDCERCKLCRSRTNLVFGEGSPHARLVFVGEGPGREEDLEGRPFVGEAGKLLTRIIGAMGLTREDVYICNVVKCRPPNNRDPEPDEIMACIPFLKKQIELIRPDVICALGRVAAQELLDKDIKITKERGKWDSYMDIPVMPTYHPAYLNRNPSAKRPVWEDVQKIMKLMGLEVKRDG
ncbi:MAG: uracil-DNA glycosylase [Thermodesulfobacteriota bacterium]|nr:uracil-DNA glycosylase [Thermodesulfobacteriota bacterium]